MAKMKAPADNKSGAGFNGEFYPVDKKGIIDVPDEAVPDLLNHGFVPDVLDVPEVPEKPAKA